MTTEQYIKLEQYTALISFLIWTASFILYFYTSSFELLSLGYGIITAAGLINVGILISILFKASKDKDKKRKII